MRALGVGAGLLIAAMLFGQAAPAPALSEGAYAVGPGDQLSVQVLDVEEYNGGRTVRVDDGGFITLPYAGRVQVSGQTARQLEVTLTTRLNDSIVKPVVSVAVLTQRTIPVLVSGAVRTPGLINLTPGKSLLEALAVAGGATSDAGYRVRLTRRASAGEIPLAGAKLDATGQNYSVDISLRELQEGDSSCNVPVMANDSIQVPSARPVYVIGDVKQQGAVTISEDSTISIIEAYGRAGGANKTAQLGRAYLERVGAADKREKIPVDLDKILNGKADDVRMQARDILVIPGSGTSQNVIDKAVGAILAIGTGALLRF